jgi:YrhK-like protein
VIGHALTVRPTPETRAVWDRWIGIGFAIGSLCFFVGPFPGVIDLVGAEADAIIFFVGSIFFTLAALLEVREGTLRIGRRWAADASWWSAAIQFVGTLLFNLDTFDALNDNLSSGQEDTLVFAPDLIGSACFLVSGVIAYWVVTGPRLLPAKRDREWTMTAVNFLGCVFFGISAIASYIVPSTGSILDLAAVNWGTGLGALCFFIGAVMLLPRRHGVPRPKEA